MDRSVVRGVGRALVLAPGIVPLAVLFGAAAAEEGLSALQATASSALVFAGGAQFASLALASAGAAGGAIVALVAVINSRYLLLSTATLELGREAGALRWQRWLLALGVVDESYALQAAWVRDGGHTPLGLLVVPATLWTIWVGFTAVGALAGARLPDLERFGLDYALPGIFLGLLGIFGVPRGKLLAGGAAVVLGGALALAGYGVVAALVVPPALSVALGRWAR